MHLYPIFLNLSGQRALILGAGRVGRRKLASLLPCGLEEILLLEVRDPDPELLALMKDAPVRFRCLALGETAGAEDLQDVTLAFAASSDRAANAHLARLCREKGILCNSADAPEDGAFQVPASCSLGQLTAAFSTSGLSPALARYIRQEAETWLGGRFGPLLTLMGRLRPLVLDLGQGTEANTELFRALVRSPLGKRLAAKDTDAAERLLRELLPVSLHPCIGDLLHEPL